ncbi:MAG: type II toxin-antitoxin system Phd/YefM family antitoxin [Caldilineaceae bacterium]|nr:type II toxin-antitoxin system Phd/YefM family antitoxin [Caldilineaceae bacterium]
MITFKSSEAQQNFGMVMEHALAEGDVVIERYGAPRVAIINFKRYQRLLDAERELLRLRLQQASAAVTARAAHLSDAEIDQLIEEARNEVYEEGRQRVARDY